MPVEVAAGSPSTTFVQGVADIAALSSDATSDSSSSICSDSSIVHTASPTPAYGGGGAEAAAELSILARASQGSPSVPIGVPTVPYVVVGSELDNAVVASRPVAVGSVGNSVGLGQL